MANLSLPIVCFSLLLAACFTSSQSQQTNVQCPYDFVYHFGDGTTDIGNSVLIKPWGKTLASAYPPYGMTYPGYPTGRWSDGLIDFDFAATHAGYPGIVPYLGGNFSTNAVIFSVARSTVLDKSFFKARGIEIPPHSVSLRGQLKWFRRYLRKVTSTQQDSFNRVRSSIIFLGDIEGNDVGYPLSQGIGIAEVKTYVPFIIKEQEYAMRELISMGVQTLVIPGSTALGCYPYILTAMTPRHFSAYDQYGCLKIVNDLIDYKNNYLEQTVANLTVEFPEVTFMYSPFAQGVMEFMKRYVGTLNSPGTMKLDTCCGIGGQYHYDSERFCGSEGVPVCSNPNECVFWDGIHFTQEAYRLTEEILFAEAIVGLNCTVTPVPSQSVAAI